MIIINIVLTVEGRGTAMRHLYGDLEFSLAPTRIVLNAFYYPESVSELVAL